MLERWASSKRAPDVPKEGREHLHTAQTAQCLDTQHEKQWEGTRVHGVNQITAMLLGTLLLAGIGGILLVWLLRAAWRFYQVVQSVAKLPGPPYRFPSGTAAYFYGEDGQGENYYQKNLELMQQHPGGFRIWRDMFTPVVFPLDPRVCQEIFMSKGVHKEIGFMRTFMSDFLGQDALILAEGETWKKSRKALSMCMQFE